MITKPTVFILGAGASAPYGLPTGEELRKKILDNSTNDSYQGLFAQMGYDSKKLDEFTEAFRRSGTSSIDAFLEHRPEFLKIGKIAISIFIINSEEENRLYIDDWYRYIFAKMNSSFEEFRKNKLSILTFNYDRSFEHFLFVSLKNLFGKTDKECREAVESIPIIHLHGKIGNLPWQDGDRPYEHFNIEDLNRSLMATNWLQEGIDGIKITHEGSVKPSVEFDKAYDIMSRAKRIYFLGFGFHPINVERLRIKNFSDTYFSQATGTTYHLTDVERNDIQTTLLHNIFELRVPNARNQQVLDFLRENVILN